MSHLACATLLGAVLPGLRGRALPRSGRGLLGPATSATPLNVGPGPLSRR